MNIVSELDINAEKGDIENTYYAPHLEQLFTVILTRTPLWSNIMMAVFNSTNVCASSSGLESYFKNLKRFTGTSLLLLIISEPMSLFKFIVSDLKKQLSTRQIFTETHFISGRCVENWNRQFEVSYWGA